MIEEQDVVISAGDKHSYTRKTLSVPDGVVVMSRKQVKQLWYCIGRVKDADRVQGEWSWGNP